jgi:hypothetical protein
VSASCLERLPAGVRAHVVGRGGARRLLFDVEGQDALAAYLRWLYGARLSIKARAGRAPKLRLAP